jgi:hypothetical protein
MGPFVARSALGLDAFADHAAKAQVLVGQTDEGSDTGGASHVLELAVISVWPEAAATGGMVDADEDDVDEEFVVDTPPRGVRRGTLTPWRLRSSRSRCYRALATQ